MMTISAIEIKNVKGIDHRQFKLQLIANKPNLLVAPNGFGKSSIATAFSSMNSKRMKLAEEDHHKENVSLQPELSVTFNDQKLIADSNKNDIRQELDVTVIRSGLFPKATKHNFGRFTQAKASLEIESIQLRKIPVKKNLSYNVSAVRSAFGASGKVLPNIGSLLKKPVLCDVVCGCNLRKLSGLKIQQAITAVVDRINEQSGTTAQIRQFITDNLLSDFRAIAPLNNLASKLAKLNLASSKTEAFLMAYQVAEIYKGDSSTFETAINWLKYEAEKKYYRDIVQSFCSSTWQWAKLTEDRKKKDLSVTFPKAHQISNGQRDVLTLVVHMHMTLYGGSKKPLILVIDEVFDYLDDANLVAFQYYITSLIEEYKTHGQEVYPIILTHLDPGIFFDFCFNKYKIHTHYLQTKPSGKCRDMLRLIEARASTGTTEGSVRECLDKHWFHFHPDNHEIQSDKWPENLRNEWRKSKEFHAYIRSELDRYLQDKNYDALAVCVGVRVMIEKGVYDLLGSDDQREGFVATHKTKEKLNFAASHLPDIPETYFLLGLVHNKSLHWKHGKDFVSPLVSKLNHPIIRRLIAELE